MRPIVEENYQEESYQEGSLRKPLRNEIWMESYNIMYC